MIRRVADVAIDDTTRARVLAGTDAAEVLVVIETWRARLRAWCWLAFDLYSASRPVPTGALGAAILDARQVAQGASR